MDEGYWIIVTLSKGKLGEQAPTLGSLIFTVIKNAIFRFSRYKETHRLRLESVLICRTGSARCWSTKRLPNQSAYEEATMAALEVTKKLHVYHILYRLNISFSNIVSHCRALQEAGSFTAKSSRLFQGYAQELQAEINQELLETMHQTELDDWGRFGKIRQAEEKRLRDPADVLIHAEEYKRSLKAKREPKDKKKS